MIRLACKNSCTECRDTRAGPCAYPILSGGVVPVRVLRDKGGDGRRDAAQVKGASVVLGGVIGVGHTLELAQIVHPRLGHKRLDMALGGEQQSTAVHNIGERPCREVFFDFLRRRPDTAIDVLVELGQRLKHTDDILRTRVSRNANEEHDETISPGQRIADIIADFSGSLPFLFINLMAFVVWIALNTAAPLLLHDPFPFQFLTMAVSLEAIFLSIFVLISQNRQATKDRIKADLDYQVNVKAEMEMSVMAIQIRDIQRKLHYLHCDVLEVKDPHSAV